MAERIKPRDQRPGSRRTPLIVTEFGDFIYDEHGDHAEISDMLAPYRCTRCGTVYDGGYVEVKARYADCSVWNCPGCGRDTDSRHAWSGVKGAHMGYTDLREAGRA